MSSRPKILGAGRGLFQTKNRADAFFISLAVAATLLIAAAVWWTLRKIESQVQNQVAESLQTVVATTQEGIGLWITATENPVSIIARRPEVVAAIEAQRQLSSRPEALRQSAAMRELREFLAPVLELYRYDFSVVDENWIQIATLSDVAVGTKFPKSVDARPIESALNGQIGVGLSSGEGTMGSHAVIVAAPVKNDKGTIQAALVFFVDPRADFNGITRRGRIGTSGETYVFDRHGRMLTDSRFRPDRSMYVADQVHGSKVGGQLTKMAQSALAGRSGLDVEGYPDYRGIDVFGAWAWDSRLNVGIATEIDRSEALIPYRGIRALTLLMLLLIIGTFVLLLAVMRHRNRIVASNWAFQESIKARQDTLAVVSHDLRAPLSNVILCSNMLAKSDSDPSNLTRFAEMIRRSSIQMDKLISDLLDVSEMEMGRLRIEKKPCEINALLGPLRDTFMEQARANSIELVIPSASENPQLLADPDRLIQVLSNLVGNALKFTPAGGKVSVHTAVSPREVRFQVRDTGPGISEDARPHVFEQFWKTKASGKRGRGLGLFIAKMIVERHNGKIWVESDGRTGSTFCFTIPH